MRRTPAGVLSPIESLFPAWHESVRLLFRPFARRRWIELSLLCLFLGGGTSTAAFQWGFGGLPIDLHVPDILLRIRLVIAQHFILIVLAVFLSLALILGLIYTRCVLRFILIDAVIRQNVAVGSAWKKLEPLGRSYFLWLLAVVGVLLAVVSGATIASIRLLSIFRAGGYPWWVGSLLLVIELIAVVLVGLMVAVLITLTDDLVSPVMYASGASLPAAWRTVWHASRHDRGTLVFYVVLRFAVSIGISIGVLVVLFPILMGLSSGALITAALAILALRGVGLAWAWNPLTIAVGVFAMGFLTLLVFALLSVVGMPGQVYLQNYGVRFIASRVSSLGAVCRGAPPGART